mmetsp:Transcript_45871/g.111739  ORF Transcript_45871/g.111739 Transcript_45871/m.111739 type:complete len:207 (+) Transcript_45871:931-1551(+)
MLVVLREWECMLTCPDETLCETLRGELRWRGSPCALSRRDATSLFNTPVYSSPEMSRCLWARGFIDGDAAAPGGGSSGWGCAPLGRRPCESGWCPRASSPDEGAAITENLSELLGAARRASRAGECRLCGFAAACRSWSLARPAAAPNPSSAKPRSGTEEPTNEGAALVPEECRGEKTPPPRASTVPHCMCGSFPAPTLLATTPGP